MSLAAITPVDRVISQPSEAAEPILAMSRLGAGQRGRIARVEGEADDATRLKALGLCEGREIEVIRSGHSLIVRVLGSRIGIARRLADRVLLAAG